jgi:hypothetical protein
MEKTSNPTMIIPKKMPPELTCLTLCKRQFVTPKLKTTQNPRFLTIVYGILMFKTAL